MKQTILKYSGMQAWNKNKQHFLSASEIVSSKSSSYLKPNKIKIIVISALAAMSFSQTTLAADPVDDADVNNPAGTTIYDALAGYGVRLIAGGPYTVINAGDILADDDVTDIRAIDIGVGNININNKAHICFF